MIDANRLLNPHEAAEYLRLEQRTLNNWRHRRQGPPYYRVGARIRYSLPDLQAWVAAQAADND